jgi:hypothetical protein
VHAATCFVFAKGHCAPLQGSLCLSRHGQMEGAVDLAKALVQVTATASPLHALPPPSNCFHFPHHLSHRSLYKRMWPSAGCIIYQK